MTSKNDLLFSLVVAVLLHVMAGYCIGRLISSERPSTIMPVFKVGMTSIEMNLVSVLEPEPIISEEPEIAEVPKPEPKPPEPKKEPREIVRADTGVRFDEAPTVTADSSPKYPLGSRIRGEEGLVRVRVWIDSTGRAARTEIVESSGFNALDQAAVKSLKRATFRDEAGRLVSSFDAVIPFRFRLTD